jgi:hypothetical protein
MMFFAAPQNDFFDTDHTDKKSPSVTIRDETFLRLSATYPSFVFLLGIVALIWVPETKGKLLPTD